MLNDYKKIGGTHSAKDVGEMAHAFGVIWDTNTKHGGF